MGILEMDFERILGVTFFHSSFHSIMLWFDLIKKGPKFCNKVQKHKSIIKSALDASKSETESHSIGYVIRIQRWMALRAGLYR